MKNTGLIILGVLILAIIAIAGFFIGTYNKLQVMDENVTANWAQVENQLKRRNDLIPNLVNTVKGYAKHENEIFTNIANARSKLSGAMNTNDVKAVQQSTNELNSALSRLLVVVENYPNLKADKAFTGLQDELAGTENRLAVARMDYNESVKNINTVIRTFPTSLVAAMSGVKSRDYLKLQSRKNKRRKLNFKQIKSPQN